MVIPVKVGLWSVLLIGCYCLWNFSKRDIVSKLFKFGRQIYLAFLLYLGLHILCTKLMVTGSRAQYQINGYQLRMSHCNQGTFFSSAGSYTMVSLTEKRILCTGRSPCGFCDYRLYLCCCPEKDRPRTKDAFLKGSGTCQDLSQKPDPLQPWC